MFSRLIILFSAFKESIGYFCEPFNLRVKKMLQTGFTFFNIKLTTPITSSITKTKICFFWPILFNSSFLTTLFFFVMSTAFLSIVSSKIKMFRSRLEWIDHLLLAYTACLLCYMCTFDRTNDLSMWTKNEKSVCVWLNTCTVETCHKTLFQ